MNIDEIAALVMTLIQPCSDFDVGQTVSHILFMR